jgi:hypothetical protein
MDTPTAEQERASEFFKTGEDYALTRSLALAKPQCFNCWHRAQAGQVII